MDVVFYKTKKLRSEDPIRRFFLSLVGVSFGKILSLLKARKTPIILGWFHTDFLPCNFLFPYFGQRCILQP
jgi:hypothetical protein